MGRHLWGFVLVVLLAAPLDAQDEQSFDLIIRGGRVVDGTGNPWVSLDVGIRGDRIARIGDLSAALARRVINGSGLVVAPGFIDTDMTKALTDDQKALMLGQIPLGRLGEPQEIAKVVAFLASDSGSYITGETIHVNGGMYM